MKLMIVVGARPNFMKAAPILKAIHTHNHDAICPGAKDEAEKSIVPILVHTGQHYDESMSGSFFGDLDLPKPDVHLGVGSGSHASQTAEVMKRFEEVLLRLQPDYLIVVGDVNSTLACALVAAKISFDASGRRPLIAHVEAGLRSRDRSMPEEINRILTDHLSDLLFVTEASGMENLANEGIPADRVHFVGNTMIDTLLSHNEKANESKILEKLSLRPTNNGPDCEIQVAKYALLTLHRPSNVDSKDSLIEILKGLRDLTAIWPVIFPVHPRTQKRIVDFGLEGFFEVWNENHSAKGGDKLFEKGKIHLINPQGYVDFLCLMMHAALVVTDSGGIQEETTGLGVPCVTVRENTERPVTVLRGTNILAGTSNEGIRTAVHRQLTNPKNYTLPERWDGNAARRIVEILSQQELLKNTTSASTAGHEIPPLSSRSV